jgi:hypothetical protein
MEADENGAELGHTGGWGASETRSWRFGAANPQVKLILVRFPDG